MSPKIIKVHQPHLHTYVFKIFYIPCAINIYIRVGRFCLFQKIKFFKGGGGGGKSWIYFLLAYMMKDIEIFIMLFTGSKNIDFSWRYVPKKLVFYTCESRLSRRFSRNRVFLPILLEFSRYLLAVFDVIKVLILRKKSMETIFDFLIVIFYLGWGGVKWLAFSCFYIQLKILHK